MAEVIAILEALFERSYEVKYVIVYVLGPLIGGQSPLYCVETCLVPDFRSEHRCRAEAKAKNCAEHILQNGFQLREFDAHHPEGEYAIFRGRPDNPATLSGFP
jgi:hypothetical protein